MTSTIKVNTVKDTASTDIIKKCGTSITVGTASDTTTVAGNAVRSNAIQASDGQNIISQVGATITLGATGDNIVLAGGATQSGFGRTGTVDWQTTPKTTGTFTAVSGEGYFLNTSGGVITANLPAGVAGAIVSFADYAATWQTNKVTVVPNGTDKIGSQNENASLNTEGQSVTFVFVDSTQGWINTMDSTSNVRGAPPFIDATGGTITTSPCGNDKIHTFTGPGSFTVNSIAQSAANNEISYMIVAGGGSAGEGSGSSGGGGGAGGFREVKTPITPYTASPLDGYGTPGNRVTVTAQTYAIAIGGGSPGQSTSGNNSTALGFTAAGGGRGSTRIPGNVAAGAGGSGGGGDGENLPGSGAGNTPPTTPAQGTAGGTGQVTGGNRGGGGGGGATVAGTAASSPQVGGAGGAGATTSINGSPTAFAGGGGGSGQNGNGGAGGAGGGGAAGGPFPSPGTNGTANTGGGGGAANNNCGGGLGGSGIVIIRYKFQ